MVPLRPGNAGGGKDPDFWRAFDGGEDEVIGGEPANTRTDPDPPAKAVSQGKAEPAFLVPGNRVPRGSTRRFSYEAVFGELGVLELRQFRRDAPPCALR